MDGSVVFGLQKGKFVLSTLCFVLCTILILIRASLNNAKSCPLPGVCQGSYYDQLFVRVTSCNFVDRLLGSRE